jgi:hypothetical protein
MLEAQCQLACGGDAAWRIVESQLDRKQLCQPGTSVHKIHVNCITHVTLRHWLTHLGCVYNRSL